MMDIALISQDLANRTFYDEFRLLVGQGKRFSVSGLAQATGIPPRTISSYLAGDSAPGLGNCLTISAVLGPEFLSAILMPTPFMAVMREPDQVELGDGALKVLDVGRALLKAQTDGGINHLNRNEVRNVLREVIQLVVSLEMALSGEDKP